MIKVSISNNMNKVNIILNYGIFLKTPKVIM